MLNKHIEQIIFILILFVPFSEKLRQSRVFQHMNITCNRERSLTRGGARSHALLIYLHFNMLFFFFFFSRSDVSIGFIYYFNVSIAVGI